MKPRRHARCLSLRPMAVASFRAWFEGKTARSTPCRALRAPGEDDVNGLRSLAALMESLPYRG